MRIICPACEAVYQIPQELLPQGERIAFTCEKCGNKIAYSPPTSSKDARPQPERPAPKASPTHDIKKVRALKRKIRLSLMGFIPAVAQVIARAQMVMANPYSGLKDLAKVIETDQGITARALKVANSAYYGLSGKVTSISHASVLLGNKILGEIITMVGVRGFLGERLKGYGLDSEVLWRHSLAVAVGSKLFAAKKCPELAEEAFVAGLVHDAGMIMLDPHIFEKKEAFDAIVSDGLHTFLQGERAVLGTDHPEVGGEMLGEWGIPRTLLKPIANHHRPSASGEDLAYIVHLADILAKKNGYGTGIEDALYQVDEDAMEFMGFQDEEDLIVAGSEMGEAVEKIRKEVLEEPL
ncbi:MAG: zinc-ribbon domain-containing protein [Deltaproteobacteria bacterium]|nr:zinc-ribbon domain-containing protein [Deltaproteobacteria bacterium]